MMPPVVSTVNSLFRSVKRGEVDICESLLAPVIHGLVESGAFECSLDLVGEILVIAATLVYMKSRCFLPSPASEEEEEAPHDLEERSLEYQQVRKAALTLQEREAAWTQVFQRQAVVRGEETLSYEVTLFDLLMALEGVLVRVSSPPSLEVVREGESVEEKASIILERLAEEGVLSFSSLFSGDESRLAVIVTFLALLELMRRRIVAVTQDGPFGSIRIWRNG